MIKKHLKTIITTSLITLVPMIVGIVLWNKLPAEIPTHFGINNEPDDYSSKAFVVFGMPVLMLAMHLVCILATKLDPKNKNYSDKVFTMVLYIIPAVSLLICGMIYPIALGNEMRVGLIVILFMGLLFTVTGSRLIPWASSFPGHSMTAKTGQKPMPLQAKYGLQADFLLSQPHFSKIRLYFSAF